MFIALWRIKGNAEDSLRALNECFGCFFIRRHDCKRTDELEIMHRTWGENAGLKGDDINNFSVKKRAAVEAPAAEFGMTFLFCTGR